VTRLLTAPGRRGPAVGALLLGEGTFLDLLKFISEHAPDAASAAAARLAHRDERRHVHFGVSHIHRAIDHDPELRTMLVAAAEGRAAKLVSLSGLSPGFLEAAQLRKLMWRMERNRIRGLRACGFDATTAHHISDLHTPNLM
jgi:hypothetical protein